MRHDSSVTTSTAVASESAASTETGVGSVMHGGRLRSKSSVASLGRPIGPKSGIAGVPTEVLVEPDREKVPIGWCPISRDPLVKTDDPWGLPPTKEIPS